MRIFGDNGKLLIVAACLALATIPAGPTAGLCQPASVDPEADKVLRRMGDFMAGLEQFEVRTENTLEVIARSGQKIQFDNPASLSIKRPDKLRAERIGDIVNQEFYYDGKTLALFMKDENVYASVEAPPTIEQMLDYARESLDVFAPGGDLVYKNAYDILMEDVVSGFYVGSSVVGGVKCHHLAYRANDTDWQIWIEVGDKPLPKKFIVTSKWMTGAPQFAVHVESWDMEPKFDDDIFAFTPPANARKVDFISPAAGKMQGR